MVNIFQVVPQAADICFLDATSSLDRTDCKVFRLVCPSPAGGLPLGILILTSEGEDVVTEGLQIFRDKCAPSYAFKGRGSLGPRIFMTDDCSSEINSIKTVFPQSTTLLCQWHLQAAVWRWIYKSEHGIEKKDRPILLKLFQKLIYAKTNETYEDARLELYEDETANDYPQYLQHLSSQYFHRLDTWTTFARLENNLSTHHHTTNNLVESSFNVLKSYTFNREMEFNIAALLLRLLTEDSIYYEGKLIDIGNSVFSQHVKRSSYNQKVTIPMEDITEVCLESKIFYVKSQSEADIYYQCNMKSGLCTCKRGRDLGPCKHKALTECIYHS